MHKVEKNGAFSSKSYCKVGKITPSKNSSPKGGTTQTDSKSETFKKSNFPFTETIKDL